MTALNGIAASPGIAIGKAFVYRKGEVATRAHTITDTKEELERLKEALEISKRQLEKVKDKAAEEIGESEAQIFQAHLLILEDPALLTEVTKYVEGKKVNAEVAVQEFIKKYVAIFETMKDEYFKARAEDIQDVGNRILNNLSGITCDSLAKLRSKVIVVSKVLTPSDTAQMNKEMVLGFATDTGGLTSHTAIIARSLNIPAVVGLGNATGSIRSEDDAIIDGFKGIVIINPSKDILTQYEKKKMEYEKQLKELKKS